MTGQGAVRFEGSHLPVWDPHAEGLVVLVEFGVHGQPGLRLGGSRHNIMML